jgi:hypothetical protein
VFPFIKEIEEEVHQGTVTSSKINFIPFKDLGNKDGSFPRKDLHLRTVDKAFRSELELEINLLGLIKANGRAGSGTTDQRKMDSWVNRGNGELHSRVFFSERFQKSIGGSTIPSQDTMFHLVEGKTEAPDLIHHTIEKSGNLPDRLLETQLDHTVNHSRIVNINPEGKPLIPFLKGVKIEGL